MRLGRICFAAVALFPACALAQLADTPPAPTTQPQAQPASAPPLETVLQIDAVATGFTKTVQGRVFLALSRIDGSAGPQVVEWVDGKPAPYPDATWNSWTTGDETANKFVRVNALRIGPRGSLWIVDTGAPGLDNPRLPGGPKIVKINLATNTVAQVFHLDAVTNPKSVIDDMRFHGSRAYITDAGSPGVIILDLRTGAARRILDGDPSLTAQRPISVDDHVLRGPNGAPVKIHADQLEVSPDGRFFFYQPASGPMSRVATRYLDDAKLDAANLSKHITTFSRTGSTGGTAIDANGTIYCSDTDKHRIVTIDSEGRQQTLVQDPRLLWVDAMWIDDKGYLFMPAAQLDRMAPFNHGESKLQLPISVYRVKIDAKPPPSDHP